MACLWQVKSCRLFACSPAHCSRGDKEEFPGQWSGCLSNQYLAIEFQMCRHENTTSFNDQLQLRRSLCVLWVTFCNCNHAIKSWQYVAGIWCKRLSSTWRQQQVESGSLNRQQDNRQNNFNGSYQAYNTICPPSSQMTHFSIYKLWGLLLILKITVHNKQESCAIAKTTARCALYIGYSTIILFTPTFTTLCGFDSERI